MRVNDICKLFGSSKQAYYKRDSLALQTRLLQEQIAIDYALSVRKSDSGIGARKLHAMYCKESACEGKPLSRDHFFRLLRERQMMLRVHRSTVPRTTDSRHNLPLYPNKVWDVIPLRANQIWVSDITYIKVWDDKAHTQYHFCYLSLITDAYSKMVKGYTVSETMETVHPLSALQMALKSQPQDFDFRGLTHHSDRGVQYASAQYVQLLKKHNITISMTEDGNPKHNAIAERINNTIKNEFFAKLSFESIDEVRENVREAVEFYNQRRPHMSINGLTPAEAEEQVGEIKKQWYSYREQAIKGLAM